jgi:hypothetical protein
MRREAETAQSGTANGGVAMSEIETAKAAAYAEENVTNIMLLRAWRNGSARALRQLVTNLRNFVFSEITFMQQRMGRRSLMCDLRSAAHEGMYVGLTRFDESKGAAITTYVSYWIRAFLRVQMINDWSHGTMRKMGPPQLEALATAIDKRLENLEHLTAEGVSQRVVDSLVARKRFELEWIDEHVNEEMDENGEPCSALDKKILDRSDASPTPEDMMISAQHGMYLEKSLNHAFTWLTSLQMAAVKHVMDGEDSLAEFARRRGVSPQASTASWRSACRVIKDQVAKCEIVQSEVEQCQKKTKRTALAQSDVSIA